MRNDDYSHNRRQTEYNQVYLNCWGAKEEKNFLNDTNGHKFILWGLGEIFVKIREICGTNSFAFTRRPVRVGIITQGVAPDWRL